MKRFILISTLAFIVSVGTLSGMLVCLASQQHMLGVLARKNGSVTCDDCSGTRTFAWHMENVTITSGDPCGCSDGDTSAAATGSVELSGTQKMDGTYSIKGDASNEYYTISISSNDTLNTDDFKIVMYVYIDTFESGRYVFQALNNADNRIWIELSGSSVAIDLYAWYKHNSTGDFIALNSNRVEDEWLYIEYRAKTGVAGNDHYFKVCDSDGVSNCTTLEEDDDLTTLAAAAPDFEMGLIGTVASACIIYIDDIDIDVSGY